jgi:hypothetical protein
MQHVWELRKFLVGKPEGRRPLRKPRHVWEIILDWILGK